MDQQISDGTGLSGRTKGSEWQPIRSQPPMPGTSSATSCRSLAMGERSCSGEVSTAMAFAVLDLQLKGRADAVLPERRTAGRPRWGRCSNISSARP